MKAEHLNWLKANNASNKIIKWIKKDKISSLEEAWNTCERGDWLLWMAGKLGVDRHKLGICAALCARTSVQYMEDSRSRNAVRVAFLFLRGKATAEELEKARTEAVTAWQSVGTWDARAAVYAAAYATVCTVDDDDRVTDTWAAMAAAADKKDNQRKTAEIARKMLTDDVLEKTNN